jgi:hypothetical protein
MKTLTMVLAVGFAAASSAGAGLRFGLAKSAAQRASDIAGEALPENLTLVLPISPAQMNYGSQVLWPFGVQGGGHPHGHPGIDFYSVPGADVVATAPGRVAQIIDEPAEPELRQKNIKIEHGGGQTYYIGTFRTISVSVGDYVKQGQKIGVLGPIPTGTMSYGFMHWGVGTRTSQTSVCPRDYLSPSDQAALDRLQQLSSYLEKSQYPLICNPCPAGGCY